MGTADAECEHMHDYRGGENPTVNESAYAADAVTAFGQIGRRKIRT